MVWFGPIQFVLHILLWTALALYGFSSLWWLLEILVLSRGWKSNNTEVWGLDDIQVRILTIDAEAVVQPTVNVIPDNLTDVRVIAEANIAIDGATVHVVPDEFTCDATNKGRAVEWARRNVECHKEYVLYLDEEHQNRSDTGNYSQRVTSVLQLLRQHQDDRVTDKLTISIIVSSSSFQSASDRSLSGSM